MLFAAGISALPGSPRALLGSGTLFQGMREWEVWDVVGSPCLWCSHPCREPGHPRARITAVKSRDVAAFPTRYPRKKSCVVPVHLPGIGHHQTLQIQLFFPHFGKFAPPQRLGRHSCLNSMPLQRCPEREKPWCPCSPWAVPLSPEQPLSSWGRGRAGAWIQELEMHWISQLPPAQSGAKASPELSVQTMGSS